MADAITYRIADTVSYRDPVTDAVTHVHRDMSDGNAYCVAYAYYIANADCITDKDTDRITYAVCLANPDCVTDKDTITNRVTHTDCVTDTNAIPDP